VGRGSDGRGGEGRGREGTEGERREGKGRRSGLPPLHIISGYATVLCPQYVAIGLEYSGLSPGSREAKFRGPRSASIARSQTRSSCWSLPVTRYLSDTRCKGSVVVLER